MDRFTRFIDQLEMSGHTTNNPVGEDWGRETTRHFIDWLRKTCQHNGQPISDTTINRTLTDVRAAFRFVMDRPPTIRLIPGAKARGGARKQKLSINQMTEAFRYAFECERRKHLQAYLVAAVCTLGRPDSILDIATAPERDQIDWEYKLLNQNPRGRTQTKKARPVIPINPTLAAWLTWAEYRRQTARRNGLGDDTAYGFLVTDPRTGRRLASTRRMWNTMKEALGWPMERDWDAKMIRHTVATWLRSQGVDWAELQGFMGHRIPGVTEDYAEYDPKYLSSVTAGIDRYLAQIQKSIPHCITPFTPQFNKTVVTLSGI